MCIYLHRRFPLCAWQSRDNKTRVQVVRERCRENVRKLEKVAGGLLQLSHSNTLFSEIFNVS